MSVRGQCLVIFASLLGALCLASLVAAVLRLHFQSETAKPVLDNLGTRIRAWWMMVLLVGGAVLAGQHAVILLFAIVSVAALREFLTLTATRGADYGALLLSFFVALPMQYGLIWLGWYGLSVVLIPVYGFLILPIAAVLFADPKNFLARTSETQWGLMICVYCLSYVPSLLMLDISGYRHHNALLIAFLLIVVQLSDIFQYIFGKLFGRHPIAPSVSPSKTFEGLVGGMACATAVGAALWRITPFHPWQAAGMALVITLMGFLGGLVMSAIKRDRGVKDWGHLIAGHGGVLDRVDSVAFSAPIFFHLTRYFFAT